MLHRPNAPPRHLKKKPETPPFPVQRTLAGRKKRILTRAILGKSPKTRIIEFAGLSGAPHHHRSLDHRRATIRGLVRRLPFVFQGAFRSRSPLPGEPTRCIGSTASRQTVPGGHGRHPPAQEREQNQRGLLSQRPVGATFSNQSRQGTEVHPNVGGGVATAPRGPGANDSKSSSNMLPPQRSQARGQRSNRWRNTVRSVAN